MYTSYYRPAYRKNMTRTARPQEPVKTFPVDQVWGAAAAAQRINGDYVKEARYQWDEVNQVQTLVTRRNRDIMTELLDQPHNITAQDIEAGQQAREWLRDDLMLRAIKNRLTEFDQSVRKVLDVADNFDSYLHRLELAVVACLPASHQRGLKRQDQEQRMRQASGELVGQPGNKVSLRGEVVKANFSQHYGVWFITVIDTDNRAVFFSYRNQLAVGTVVDLRGTVKAHRDGTTQLNRVALA
jgi:hypothetical protein